MKKNLILFFVAVSFLGVSPSVAQEQAAPAPMPAWLEYKNPYTGEENNVANPHRTTDEITTWAQQTAAEVLTLTPADYTAKLKEFKAYFVQEGWQQYVIYLKDSKLIDMVRQDGYSVSTIVDEVPEIISHAPAAGVYHWIVKMPVTISFFVRDIDGNTKTGASGKYILFMDMQRVADGAVAIANWRVDDAPRRSK